MLRRTFLAAAVAPPPVIDAHIHLFDPNRPQGIPWPKPDNPTLYKPALPARYKQLAVPHGVTGAIMVECSPWIEDNQWVLDTIKNEPIMLGMIGNLEAGTPAFAAQLERFKKNPLFLGIRYGNLWDRDFTAQVARPQFIADIKNLANAKLTLDTANPTPQLIADLIKLTDAVPNLRLVVDHLPQIATPPRLAELAKRPQVFIKISEVLRRVDGKVPQDLAFYRDRLDTLTGLFGPNRVIFGSDWPNSDNWAPYADGFNLVKQYFSKPADAAKYFHTNSRAAYLWKPRKAA